MTYQYDPELAPLIKNLPESPLDDPITARENYEALIQKNVPNANTEGLQVIDKTIPSFASGVQVPVRLYIPDNAPANGPALIDIHGGGFVIGSLATEHAIAARWARVLGIVVVSVDYRLAPEHPFPAGLHDCYGALCWLHEQAQALNIDPERIALYGTSAGGGLAAGVTLLAREQGGPHICFQCLNIPELDDRLSTVSATQFTDTPIWNRPKAFLSWQYYLGDNCPRGGDTVPEQAAPARAQDLSGLPPAYICTMEFDPLRDEGIDYALRLMQAGVKVELHNYPGTFHGSAMFPVAVSKRQQKEMTEALAKGLKIESQP